MIVKCAECECTPVGCYKREYSEKKIGCINCRKQDKCCCMNIHFTDDKNQCCNDSSCTRPDIPFSGLTPQIKLKNNIRPHPQSSIGNETRSFLSYARSLCALVTILGRYDNHRQSGKGQSIDGIDSCCSVLEQDSTQRFMPNLKTTFTNFASGFKRLFRIRRQTGMKTILKSSLFILVTAESACILTAETVDLIFYQYSILLSVPFALLAGAFTVVAPAAYHRAKQPKSNAS
jgi:hypothetical protein